MSERKIPLVRIEMSFAVDTSVEEAIQLYNAMRTAFWKLKDAERRKEDGKITWTNESVYRRD